MATQQLLKDRGYYSGEVDSHFIHSRQGASMRGWQNFLNDQGFSPGPIDGKYGSMTICAMQRFFKTYDKVEDVAATLSCICSIPPDNKEPRDKITYIHEQGFLQGNTTSAHVWGKVSGEVTGVVGAAVGKVSSEVGSELKADTKFSNTEKNPQPWRSMVIPSSGSMFTRSSCHLSVLVSNA